MDSLCSAVAFLILTISEVTWAVPVPESTETYPYFLGTVDGKSFAADYSRIRNWYDARSYCNNMGMKLASINTAAEKEFLDSIDDDQFRGNFWTAGRDAQSARQFVWDDSSAPLSESFINFHGFTKQATCVYYHNKSGDKGYQSLSCKATTGVLCESIYIISES